MKPVVALYSTFLQRAYDEILHDGALQKQKLVLAVDRAGLVGEDGESHQGIYDVGFLNSIPDVCIYSPACYAELRRHLHTALYEEPGVVAVRYPRGKEPEFPADFSPSCARWSSVRTKTPIPNSKIRKNIFVKKDSMDLLAEVSMLVNQ